MNLAVAPLDPMALLCDSAHSLSEQGLVSLQFGGSASRVAADDAAYPLANYPAVQAIEVHPQHRIGHVQSSHRTHCNRESFHCFSSILWMMSD